MQVRPTDAPSLKAHLLTPQQKLFSAETFDREVFRSERIRDREQLAINGKVTYYLAGALPKARSHP